MITEYVRNPTELADECVNNLRRSGAIDWEHETHEDEVRRYVRNALIEIEVRTSQEAAKKIEYLSAMLAMRDQAIEVLEQQLRVAIVALKNRPE